MFAASDGTGNILEPIRTWLKQTFVTFLFPPSSPSRSFDTLGTLDDIAGYLLIMHGMRRDTEPGRNLDLAFFNVTLQPDKGMQKIQQSEKQKPRFQVEFEVQKYPNFCLIKLYDTTRVRAYDLRCIRLTAPTTGPEWLVCRARSKFKCRYADQKSPIQGHNGPRAALV